MVPAVTWPEPLAAPELSTAPVGPTQVPACVIVALKVPVDWVTVRMPALVQVMASAALDRTSLTRQPPPISAGGPEGPVSLLQAKQPSTAVESSLCHVRTVVSWARGSLANGAGSRRRQDRFGSVRPA